ncbi:MAG: NAD(P)/FAD-dependent oxidoreductase [Xanthobacteraceae bacterium]
MDAATEFEHGAGWYAATAVAPRRWPALTFDLDVEVCVVGGGFAGLTTALEIARRGRSVAVLEARRVAWDASGRNIGFVVPGFAQDVQAILDRCGLEQTKELWALSDDGVKYVRNLIQETAMPGVEPVDGWLDVSKVDRGDELLSFVSLLGQEFGADVEGWPTEKVREVLKTRHYFHAIHFPKAFHIHPLNYAYGLAAAAEAAGVRIFEKTPALELDPAGVRKRIQTPRARVRSDHVVLAGGAHLGAIAPRLAQTVLPVSAYVMVTEPLGERLKDAIDYRGGVSDTRLIDCHYRIVGGDRLMWAGGCTTWHADPKRQAGHLAGAVAKIFPQLGSVEIAHAWGGTMGVSVHRMPQIGELSPGLWVASALGEHGINTSAMAGTVLARAIVEGDDAWRLFLPYDLVWAGGTLGRAVMQATTWCLRTSESIAARGARQREKLHAGEEAEAEAG